MKILGYREQPKSDCRLTGCDRGECIRQGIEFVCKQGKSLSFYHFIFYFIIIINQISSN